MLVAVAARQHDGGSRQQDDHSYDGDADDIAAGAADCGTDFRLGNRLGFQAWHSAWGRSCRRPASVLA